MHLPPTTPTTTLLSLLIYSTLTTALPAPPAPILIPGNNNGINIKALDPLLEHRRVLPTKNKTLTPLNRGPLLVGGGGVVVVVEVKQEGEKTERRIRDGATPLKVGGEGDTAFNVFDDGGFSVIGRKRDDLETQGQGQQPVTSGEGVLLGAAGDGVAKGPLVEEKKKKNKRGLKFMDQAVVEEAAGDGSDWGEKEEEEGEVVLPRPFKQLASHVECLDGCIRGWGPRCKDGMMDCMSSSLFFLILLFFLYLFAPPASPLLPLLPLSLLLLLLLLLTDTSSNSFPASSIS